MNQGGLRRIVVGAQDDNNRVKLKGTARRKPVCGISGVGDLDGRPVIFKRAAGVARVAIGYRVTCSTASARETALETTSRFAEAGGCEVCEIGLSLTALTRVREESWIEGGRRSGVRLWGEGWRSYYLLGYFAGPAVHPSGLI